MSVISFDIIFLNLLGHAFYEFFEKCFTSSQPQMKEIVLRHLEQLPE